MKNPLQALADFGQSPWYDNIRRDLLASGELARMIREEGLKGLTSNPTIFEKAVSGGEDYDGEIHHLIAAGVREPKDIYEALAVADIRRAADLFAPVFLDSKGADGFVSLEVSPVLAHDVEGTVAEALRLAALVERPNAMIKVPATRAGLDAIERLTAEGLSLNVTLIFSVARYSAVAEAYLKGLEKRAAAGLPLSNISSVASFFISRIDAAVDKALDAKIAAAANAADKKRLAALQGQAAIAGAKLAYLKAAEIFAGPRFAALAAKGARAQRLLWASTGRKNPKYSDTRYIEELIGRDTVNTIPPATWTAFLDHGRARASLEEAPETDRAAFESLTRAGVDLEAVAAALEVEGVRSFADSFEKLLTVVAAKSRAVNA